MSERAREGSSQSQTRETNCACVTSSAAQSTRSPPLPPPPTRRGGGGGGNMRGLGDSARREREIEIERVWERRKGEGKGREGKGKERRGLGGRH